VLFFAGLGYQAAVVFGVDDKREVLGTFNGLWVGVIVGSCVGYVLGGVLGRTTVSAVSRTEHALRDVSAEEIVGGVFGAIPGVLVAAAVAWPVFLLDQPLFGVPIFGFLVVVLGLLGYRVGSGRHESMLGMFGPRAGMAPRSAPVSTVPRIVDTSVAIDGRILDVVRAGFLHGRMLVPTPVLSELQGLADAGDDLRRGRGRRGLATFEALRREPGVELVVLEDDVPVVPDVDAKLVRLCLDRGSALLTLDTNLARSAALAGVRVLNLHALTLALRPLVIVGDTVNVLLIKPGREPGQGVGYLDDGTMLVVEKSRDHIGNEVSVTVTSVVTTANGRLVFARMVAAPAGVGARGIVE